MKKLIAVAAMLATFSLSYGQYRGALEIGGNLMNASVSLGEDLETEPTWGVRLGYVGEYYVSDPLYFRFGALINQRGFQFAEERWGLNALDIPLNVGYALGLGDNLKFTVDGGVNVEYNFRAFTKVDDELVTLSIGGEEEDIKQVGFGANAGLGLQFSESVKFRASYYHGLANLVRTSGDEWKNRVFSLSVDFFFQKK